MRTGHVEAGEPVVGLGFQEFADSILRGFDIYKPSWMLEEEEYMKKRAQQGNLRKVNRLAYQEVSAIKSTPFQEFYGEGRLRTKDFESMNKKFSPVPTFQELIQAAD